MYVIKVLAVYLKKKYENCYWQFISSYYGTPFIVRQEGIMGDCRERAELNNGLTVSRKLPMNIHYSTKLFILKFP
jgi:hypothetical protein